MYNCKNPNNLGWSGDHENNQKNHYSKLNEPIIL